MADIPARFRAAFKEIYDVDEDCMRAYDAAPVKFLISFSKTRPRAMVRADDKTLANIFTDCLSYDRLFEEDLLLVSVIMAFISHHIPSARFDAFMALAREYQGVG